MHILDYDQYKQGGANITGLRMVDPHRRETIDVLSKWNNWEMNTGKNLNITEKTLTVNHWRVSHLYKEKKKRF
jgi:ionotropic kainate glutamate receptor 2